MTFSVPPQLTLMTPPPTPVIDQSTAQSVLNSKGTLSITQNSRGEQSLTVNSNVLFKMCYNITHERGTTIGSDGLPNYLCTYRDSVPSFNQYRVITGPLNGVELSLTVRPKDSTFPNIFLTLTDKNEPRKALDDPERIRRVFVGLTWKKERIPILEEIITLETLTLRVFKQTLRESNNASEANCIHEKKILITGQKSTAGRDLFCYHGNEFRPDSGLDLGKICIDHSEPLAD